MARKLVLHIGDDGKMEWHEEGFSSLADLVGHIHYYLHMRMARNYQDVGDAEVAASAIKK